MEPKKTRPLPFYILLALATIVFLYVLSPFFYPIFWAAIMAGLFHPLFVRINRRLRSPDFSTLVVMAVIGLIVILPAAVVASLLVKESLDLFNALNRDSSRLSQNLQKAVDWLQNHPYVQQLPVDRLTLAEKIADAAKAVAHFFFSSLSDLTGNTIRFLLHLGVMIYALYYFLRDGGQFLAMAMRVIPLDATGRGMIEEHFIKTAKATLKVTLIIGGIQGCLGWLLFVVAGIQGSLVWGVLMVATAIIPAVGCAIIWAPAGVIMLVMGHLWQGIVILVFGSVVISLVDQFLRPILIGQDVPMHPLLIFLSTLGGLVVFGLSGFVIGPIITALVLVIWDMHEHVLPAARA